MYSIAEAERAYAVAERVIAGVRPEQLDRPTPCTEWDVRALVNHMIGGHHYFSAALRGQSLDPHGSPPDFAGGDALGEFVSARDNMLAAWREPGALERTVTTLMGPMPASMLVAMHGMDNLVHSWDLAHATGQSENLDPEMATQLLVMMRDINPPRGTGQPFQAEQPAPSDATPEQQLAAYLGRSVVRP